MKILAVGLLMAIAAGAASTGQNELAGNANTPEQHRRLAESYRADSQQLMEEAQAYTAMADQYDRNPSRHPVPKFPNFGQHSRWVAEQYRKEAVKAETLAKVQDTLAQTAIADITR